MSQNQQLPVQNQQLPAQRQQQNNALSVIPSQLVQKMSSEWAKVLPKCCTPERFARVALSCISKNPALNAALQTPQGQVSILSAFMTCAEFGLEPNGRHAHLIPFRDNRNGGYQVQLIFDYKGLVELVRRSGQVRKIHASDVCENDTFKYNKGEIQEHSINFQKPRGKAYAFYCEVTFNDGSVQTDVMSKDDVDKIRARSKSSNSGPWVTDYTEMAKKSCFKRLSKWLPLSPEVKDAIDRDNENEFGDIREFIKEQRQANSRFNVIGGSNAKELATAFEDQRQSATTEQAPDQMPDAETPFDDDGYAVDDKQQQPNHMPANSQPTQPAPQKPAAKSSISSLAKALTAANAPISVSDCMEYCKATGQLYNADMLAMNVKETVSLVLDWKDSQSSAQ